MASIPLHGMKVQSASQRKAESDRITRRSSVQICPPQPFRGPQGRNPGFRPFFCNRCRAMYWPAHGHKETVPRFISRGGRSLHLLERLPVIPEIASSSPAVPAIRSR
jgi:hypothetical protein